ncbi:Acyl-CoA dehydrogenase, C-terminal domain [Micromonospora nigra]|uniref:Acyl-CoA dehydrogenase, C-terminal domain n=1 Tax=Micromonospora nigra TaxID=145857 RepID=A0A1C6SZX0_9ACTN|nr:acyl-CoA dehydrogenase family protein [Micromonospora nigra]SCL35027.1 Acyl-CoA dehydrogenase, C-terminal domain [Micromonospora nigra]
MTPTAAPPAARAGHAPHPTGGDASPQHPRPGPVDPRRHRLVAYADGPVAALAALHDAVHPGVLPAGPGGHTLLPAEVDATCDRYATGDGPRPRAGLTELARVPVGDAELVARRLPRAAPPDPAWTTGVAWIRLGLAERLLARAAAHLRGRSVAGAPTLNLPLVRALLADAAAGVAEARALLDTDAGDPSTLRRVHEGLDEVGRRCLHLFGAAGFLADGPGSEVRASELLADTYPPPTELEAP